MRRIFVIVLLVAVFAVALSVPAWAGASDPPNAWGQDTALYAQWSQDQHGMGYGQLIVRWDAISKWSPGCEYKNHGEYVNQQKADK